MATALAPVESSPTATIIFSDLPGTRYLVRQPFAVQLSSDDEGHFIACEPRTGVFHYDVKPFAAIEGFITAFISQFEFLAQKESNLSASMKEELGQFRHLIALRQ
jgi:hypothetical protein